MQCIVVGGGIVGLSTALRLLEGGYKNVKIIAENFDDTTSHTAGAVWRPFSNVKTPDFKMDSWGDETMKWLLHLLKSHGKDTIGVARTSGIELHDLPHETHPYWARSVENFRFLSSEEARKYGKEYGFSYTSLMIHPGTLMGWLTKQIQDLGGVFHQQHIDSLDVLQCDIIVNCSGLGAGKLVGDSSVYPVRGQVIKVYDPSIKNFFLVESEGEYTYILPRPGGEVILGGTVQANNWNTACDDNDIKDIMGRCAAILPSTKLSPVLNSRAGLRPCSTKGTRVELDCRRNRHGAWIIHNYGHGGSGHTIHRGCASDSATFRASCDLSEFIRNEPDESEGCTQQVSMKITVVGGGIAGLSAALALLEHGYQVKIIADNFTDTTSHTAGAVWRPVFAGSTSDQTMDKWGHETILWLRNLVDRFGADVVGVQSTSGMELFDTPVDSHPYWAHSVENFRFLTREEALSHAPYTKTCGFSYTSVMIHPEVLMKWMTRQIKLKGGVFETRHISKLDDVDGDIIINCTGIGACALVGDSSVYPVRGQVVKVLNPAIKNFIIVESHGKYTYVLPRPGGEVILGGTAEPGIWSTENNEDVVKDIIARCSAIVPEVKNSKILFAKAGLRPSTLKGTRVELDPKRTSRGALIIHNYGHGGSGHTIHRGCASNVVNIVRSLYSKM